MMKNLFQPTKVQKKGAFVATLVLFAFLMLGIGQVSAQTYVSADEADIILKAEVNTLYAQLLNETPGTSTYKYKYATVNYYESIRTDVEKGTAVGEAIARNTATICYPSVSADCNQLAKQEAATLIADTKVLLSL